MADSIGRWFNEGEPAGSVYVKATDDVQRAQGRRQPASKSARCERSSRKPLIMPRPAESDPWAGKGFVSLYGSVGMLRTGDDHSFSTHEKNHAVLGKQKQSDGSVASKSPSYPQQLLCVYTRPCMPVMAILEPTCYRRQGLPCSWLSGSHVQLSFKAIRISPSS